MRIIREPSGIRDTIEIIHFRKDGSIVSKRIINQSALHRLKNWLLHKHNSMTNLGLAGMAGLFVNDGAVTPFTFVGIGTGSTPAAGPTNTELAAPLLLKAAAIDRTTTGVTNDTSRLIVAFSSADGLSGTAVVVVEVAIFDGASNGSSVMALRQVYVPSDVMNFDQGDILQITVKIQMKQG